MNDPIMNFHDNFLSEYPWIKDVDPTAKWERSPHTHTWTVTGYDENGFLASLLDVGLSGDDDDIKYLMGLHEIEQYKETLVGN